MRLVQLQKAELVSVSIETLEGDLYRFPSMPLSDLFVLRHPSSSASFLTLVNQSNAAVTIPWRIVKRVFIDYPHEMEEVLWSRDE